EMIKKITEISDQISYAKINHGIKNTKQYLFFASNFYVEKSTKEEMVISYLLYLNKSEQVEILNALFKKNKTKPLFNNMIEFFFIKMNEDKFWDLENAISLLVALCKEEQLNSNDDIKKKLHGALQKKLLEKFHWSIQIANAMFTLLTATHLFYAKNQYKLYK